MLKYIYRPPWSVYIMRKRSEALEKSFEKLTAEKKEKILNAAYEEFTEKGYEDASTNKIVKNAGIGKGTLFYYFRNKQDLFEYLIDESIEITFKEYLNKIDYRETDIFNRLIRVGELKKEVYKQYDIPVTFFINVLLNVEKYDFLAKDLRETRIKAEKQVEDILKRNIDYSKFKEETPAPKAVQLIYWAIEGYRLDLEQRVQKKTSNHFSKQEIAAYYAEFYEYMHILQTAFYKKKHISLLSEGKNDEST